MTDQQQAKVMLAFAHAGVVHTDFMMSVLGLFQRGTEHANPIGGYITVKAGPMLTTARNIMARKSAAVDDCDWLWMVDTDIDFPPDTLDRLLTAADPDVRPIMGALYYVLNNDHKQVPAIYSIPQLGELHVPVEPAENTVMEVDAIGTGCLLIHRKVLDKLGAYPFAQVLTPTCEYSEDLSFCLRARKQGFPVHVDTSIRVGHTKPVRLA